MIQSICLFPVLRRAGFSMRLRWDLRRAEIGEIGRMGGWMFGYVGIPVARQPGRAAGRERRIEHGGRTLRRRRTT